MKAVPLRRFSRKKDTENNNRESKKQMDYIFVCSRLLPFLGFQEASWTSGLFENRKHKNKF
jgi:hypothetical protein